jgi:hypothetical protein
MEEKELSEEQKDSLRSLLDEAVQNKQHPHVNDLRRVAVILYRANQLGFTHIDVRDLLKKPEYSDMVLDWLQHTSGAISDLVYGLDNIENEKYKNFEL